MVIPLFSTVGSLTSLSRAFESVCKAVSLFENASATSRPSSGRYICEFFLEKINYSVFPGINSSTRSSPSLKLCTEDAIGKTKK